MCEDYQALVDVAPSNGRAGRRAGLARFERHQSKAYPSLDDLKVEAIQVLLPNGARTNSGTMSSLENPQQRP